jgi:hypothetical protein
MRFTVVAVAPLLVLLACSADSSGSPGSVTCGAAVAKAEAPERYVEALCSLAVHCGEIAAGDHARCVEERRRMGWTDDLAASLADPRIVYDGSAMACCVRELAARSCVGNIPASCDQAIRGTQAVDDSCDDDLHCAERYCVEGFCRAPPGEGEDCELTCAEGLTCDWQEWEEDWGTCRKPSAVGEPCRTHRACAEGLACDAAWDGTDYVGTCAPPAERGERCTDWLPCASPAEDFCAPSGPGSTEGTCEPRLPEGAACFDEGGIDWDPGCLPGLGCVASEGTAKCASLPGEGEPCLDGDCAYGFSCFRGTCRRPLYPGDACDEDNDLCIDSPCIDGVCGEYD